jgi:hypothetical protein
MLVGKAASFGGAIGSLPVTTRRTANQADRTGHRRDALVYYLRQCHAMRLRSGLSLSKGLPNSADHIGRKVRMSGIMFRVRKTRA